MQSKRKLNLEMLRIIACFLVIVNHTSNKVFTTIAPSLTWFLSIGYFYFSRIAVPIFVMISGAVLLGKQESYKSLFKKRIVKVLMLIVVFSFIYYADYMIIENKPINIQEFLISICKAPMTGSYWYLYMYLGLIVMLPILRKMVQNFSKKDYIYSFVVWSIFFSIIPIITHYLKIESYTSFFQLPIFSGFIVYFIMGYFIENKLEEKYFNKNNALIVTILSIILLIVSVVISYFEYKEMGDKLNLFMQSCIFITTSIPSISIFYLCKYIFKYKKENKIIDNLIINVSTCTLGIYLLSDLLIGKLEFIYNILVNYMNRLLAIVVYELLIFFVGFAIVRLYKVIYKFFKNNIVMKINKKIIEKMK